MFLAMSTSNFILSLFLKQHNEKVLNLLLIAEGEKQHYVLIKDFNILMYNNTKHKATKHFYMHCLQCVSTEEILTKHKENCLLINGEQAIRMPQRGKNILQLQNHHNQMPVPIVIYADFEAITEKVTGCQPCGVKSYTNKYQKHTGCSYGYKVVCCYNDKYKAVRIYRGEDSINKFMQQMLLEVQSVRRLLVPISRSLWIWLMRRNKSLRDCSRVSYLWTEVW